eukprot:84229-Rhodomonas_salina.1
MKARARGLGRGETRQMTMQKRRAYKRYRHNEDRDIGREEQGGDGEQEGGWKVPIFFLFLARSSVAWRKEWRGGGRQQARRWVPV